MKKINKFKMSTILSIVALTATLVAHNDSFAEKENDLLKNETDFSSTEENLNVISDNSTTEVEDETEEKTNNLTTEEDDKKDLNNSDFFKSGEEDIKANVYNSEERNQSFNENWKFKMGEISNFEKENFDDSSWTEFSLPNDYSIDQPYDEHLEAESGYLPGGVGNYRKTFNIGENLKDKKVSINFDGVYMNATVYINGKEIGFHPYGYTPFTFDITDYLKFGKENTIAVKVDHKTPSSRWYSGSGIYRDIKLVVTDKVHVDLDGTRITTPNLENELNSDQKNVTTKMNVKVVNDTDEDKDVIVRNSIFEKGKEDGDSISQVISDSVKISANSSSEINNDLIINSPKLWDIKNPNLYTIRTEILSNGQILDTYDDEFGYRYFTMDSNFGFSLNGKKIKLQGVSMHHDQGALGSVANKRAIERQVEILKKMGVNAIRVTHNPASKNLIEAANAQGVLVIEEIFDGWMHMKNGNSNDYAKWFNTKIDSDNEILTKKEDMTWAEFDIKTTINRDKNAPSIIMWSLGNEIQQDASGALANDYLNKVDELIKWTKEADDTRFVTIGSNRVRGGIGEHMSIAEKLNKANGTVGANYNSASQYDQIHREHPDWKIYGSETASAVNSRGIYTTKANQQIDENKQLTSYDKSKVGWGQLSSQSWFETIKRDFVAGEFVWTGFDYIGEPTPKNGPYPGKQGSWPSPKNSYFGIVDTAGFEKDRYYFYQSQWNDEVNTLHILPSWNRDEVIVDSDGKVEVVVYSDAKKVTLKLTGTDGQVKFEESQEFEEHTSDGGNYKYKTVKGKPLNHEALYMTFRVPYEDGVLEAFAYDENGDLINDTEGRKVVKTSKEPSKISIKSDRETINANGDDLAYITVDILDEDGNPVYNANNNIKFEIVGDGKLVGVDNGSSPDHQSYKDDNRNAFSGKVLAIVQSTKKSGEFTVKASSDGLEGAEVTVKTTGSKNEENTVESFTMSKNYFVKINGDLDLPKTVKVNYSNNTSSQKDVVWEDYDKENLKKQGTFTISGEVDGEKVSVNVNVIDEIGAILNYSTTTPIGVKVNLPSEREAVLKNGEIIDVSFPVEWEKIEDEEFTKEQNIIVNGKTSVFGKEYDLKATIRVQREEVFLGENEAVNAVDVKADIEGSDTLEAIRDKHTELSLNNSGGPNPTVFSNWKASNRENKNKFSLEFSYATKFNLGEVKIYYGKDKGSLRFPEKNSTKIYVSDNGSSWEEVEIKDVIIGNAQGEKENVKPYTYKIDPIGATFVKLEFTNPPKTADMAQNPSIGLVEVEMYRSETRTNTFDSAEFDEIKVDGKNLSYDQIHSGHYNTNLNYAKVEAKSRDNASVTILPQNENEVKIILESEDHETRNTFTVNFASEIETSASSSENDLTKEEVSLEAKSSYNGQTEGSIDLAFDNNPLTHWHTDWSANIPDEKKAKHIENRVVNFTLTKEETIDALRYLPRNVGGSNGFINDYLIEYSLDGLKWEKAAEGSWDINDYRNWQIAEFENPITAKYFRLIGKVTSTNGIKQSTDMSAAELRLRKVPVDPMYSEFKISNEVQTLENEESIKEIKIIVKDPKAKISVENLPEGLSIKDNIITGTINLDLEDENFKKITFTVKVTNGENESELPVTLKVLKKEEIKVKVEKKDERKEEAKAKNILTEKDFDLYEIHLEKGGKKVEEDGKTTYKVELDIPEGKKVEKVIHLGDNFEKEEEIEYKIKENKIELNLKEFSLFAVVYEKEENIQKPEEENTSTNLQIELDGENVFNEVFRGTKKEVSEEVQKAVLKYFNENKEKVELDGDPQSLVGVIIYKFKTKDTGKSITWADIEDIAKPIDKEEDHKSIPWTDIEDIATHVEKEQSEDEKWQVKPDDDKAIKDKIAELTGTKKETKEEKKEKKDDKKATNNPKTGIVSATSIVGLGTLASLALASLKKRK
ncbi:MAG: glycoside hydrolase family 2 TIM barrel-domain containing protein [Peptoniphilaceae bacterium]|nr:discoidin domain-containing protein [Peptoniphilaceae bacterium]MDD7383816.1 glycoside hydrolase family 2 TIM barrel-domain containing protein [Peptoniphilaceae bacterium]MDY3737607.1 glycoside hydrolase family 2 TIM barrel-domain containing protein [Peptoniphilaceae bacterium]